MKIADTHCHLYTSEFDTDRDVMIQRALKTGVIKMLLPNINLSTTESLHQLAEEYPLYIFPMMGIHPCDVKEDWKADWAIMKKYFDIREYAGVGEIGIDLFWDKNSQKIQMEAFEEQCAFAVEKKLPVSIHSRDATHVCLDILKSSHLKELTGVFHCFTGSIEQGKEIMNKGMYLGIGGVLTYKNTHLRETIKSLGYEKLVVETDAPYLPPVPFRGKRNEPAYLREIVTQMGMVFQKSPQEMSDTLWDNTMKVFPKLQVNQTNN